MASFPTSVWDGDSVDVDSDDGNQSSPSHASWGRVRAEIAAAQTRIYNNERGVNDDAIDSIGTLATVSGLTVVEKGDGAIHKTIFTLVEVPVVTNDGVDPTTDGTWGTTKLYTFPEGQIVILGGHQTYLTGALESTVGGGTGLSDTADLGIVVGTVAAAQSTEWGLSTTEEYICAEADVDLSGGASDAAASSVNSALVPADGSAAALSVNLNVRGLGNDDSGVVSDILKVSGTITVVWTVIGND